MKKVIKRDGTVVDFDKNRIIKAITMAFEKHSNHINKDLIEKIASQIENLEEKILSVEEIQDIVVKKFGIF